MGGLVRHVPAVRVPVGVRDLGPEVSRKDPGLPPGLTEGRVPDGLVGARAALGDGVMGQGSH
eukprot:14424255-Alexandrium_andersonii.AAC.1